MTARDDVKALSLEMRK